MHEIQNNELNAQMAATKPAQDILNNFSTVKLHSCCSEESKHQMMEQINQIDPDKVIDVVQCCLDGQFKPFLASVQMGFIDKDFVVDEQIGRRVIHLIAHYGNIKALRVLYEI